MEINGTTTFVGKFSGPIGSNIAGCVTNWEVNIFKPNKNPTFPYF